MTIPTRDELMTRWLAWGDLDWHGFALAEIRRAVAEELEALRATRVLLPAIDMKDPYALGRHDEELTWANEIERRLAAMREQPKSEASMPLAGRGLERREPGSIPGARIEKLQSYAAECAATKYEDGCSPPCIVSSHELLHLLRCARAVARLEANIHIDEMTASRLVGGGWAVDCLIACEMQGDSRSDDLLTAIEAALERAEEARR